MSISINLIPGDFPLYSNKMEIEEKLTMNGNTMIEGKTEENSVVDIDGNRDTVQQKLPDLDPPFFPENSSKIDTKTDEERIFRSESAVFYKEIEVKKDRSATFTGGRPFHIDKLKVKKRATVNLDAGTYFIQKFEIKDDDAGINIISETGEPVILHVGEKWEMDAKRIAVNSGGSVEGFQDYLHRNAEFKAK